MTGLLRLVEQFDTVQGEGPFTGQQATFLRLAGCNLSCSWCDTPYSWDWDRFDRAAESHTATPQQVAEVLAGKRLVVLTGGEPLLQRAGLEKLLDLLPDLDGPVLQYETNGTRDPGNQLAADPRSFFVVSPKLANGGDPLPRRLIPAVLDRFGDLARQGRACLKVVATTPADVHAAADLAAGHGFPPASVWVLPEGVTAAQHLTTLTRLADTVVGAGLNLTTRLHLLAWPDTMRGR